MLYPEIANRDWQQRYLKVAIDGFLPSEETDFLTVACPGAGKTRFSIAIMKAAVERDHIDLVVVVAPTETLRKQWAYDATEYGVHLHHYSSDDLREAMVDGVEEGVHGIVTTYQQMSMIEEVLEHFCASYRVMLVADEIHHCADELSWGDKLRIGFNGAKKRLILSGTPFRTDMANMPFIMEAADENQNKVRAPDAVYTYAEACDDRVCRVITFPRVNGNIRFEDDDGVWEHRLDDLSVKKSFRNKVYRAALDPDRSDFSRYLLEQAWTKLKDIREHDQKDAAMLVVAANNSHARKLRDVLHAMTGKKPVIVNTDQSDSANKIRRFRKGKQPIIIAVKMFSEGVDAPRIRVIAFLTQVKTEMWFRQVAGRASRMQDDLAGDQPAFMFIPKIPDFEEMAKNIEKEIEYIAKTQDSPPEKHWSCEQCGTENLDSADFCEECGAERPSSGGGTSPIRTFIVHGSENEEVDGFISMGHTFGKQIAEMGEELRSSDPMLKRFQAETITMIFKLAADFPELAKRFRDNPFTSNEENDDDDDY